MKDDQYRDFSDVVGGEDLHFSNSQKPNFEINHKIGILAKFHPPFILSKCSNSQLVTIAGAASGFISGIMVCPLDVIKTRSQAQRKNLVNGNPDTIKIIKSIWKNEGIRGFYRGLLPITIGYLPTWTIYFTVYENSKIFYPKYFSSETLSHVLSALTAGLASSIAVNPIWVVKTRLMIQTNEKLASKTYYKGTIDAFKTMYREEGIRVFYSGLLPSILGLVHVGIHFPVYEKLKQLTHSDKIDINNNNHLWKLIFASSISKMIASSITYPHEILRTRSQMQEKSKTNLINIIKEIYRNQGLKGFYSGYTINLIRTVPASAVTLVSFEYFKTYLLEISKRA